MIISISQIELLVREICRTRGLSSDVEDLIVTDYVGADSEGKHTHGVSKILLLDDALAARTGSPEIEQRFGALAIVNGHAGLGHQVASFGVKVACEAAETLGVGAVGIYNFARYGRLKPIALAVTAYGYAAIITNGGGPAAIAPPGHRTPILGTNPICIGIPGNPPFIADLATSERPWGEIRESLLSDKPLPERVFLDALGNFTSDPNQVEAVVPFGGWKGFALATALELLTGGLLSGRVGKEVSGQLDLGGWIIALKADALRPLDKVAESVNALRKQISAAEAGPEVTQTIHSGANKVLKEKIEISEALHARIVRMSRGEIFAGESNKMMD